MSPKKEVSDIDIFTVKLIIRTQGFFFFDEFRIQIGIDIKYWLYISNTYQMLYVKWNNESKYEIVLSYNTYTKIRISQPPGIIYQITGESF